MKDRLPLPKLIIVYLVFLVSIIYLATSFGYGVSLITRIMVILTGCCFVLLIRIIAGPTAPDRALATDIIGLIIIGFCSALYLNSGKSFYLDIAIAWALQSFIGVLALAKYLEGKKFDD